MVSDSCNISKGIGRPGTINGGRKRANPGTVGAACKDNPITFTSFTLPTVRFRSSGVSVWTDEHEHTDYGRETGSGCGRGRERQKQTQRNDGKTSLSTTKKVNRLLVLVALINSKILFSICLSFPHASYFTRLVSGRRVNLNQELYLFRQ